jgi:UDP-GlcNAc:undecaprenyl-phosphate GlcNAc-1-phosphate transferase
MNSQYFGEFMPFLVAGLVCAILLKYLEPIARDIGLVDRPTERKRHKEETPLTGGIAITVGFYISLFIVPFGLGPFRSPLLAITLLMIIGVLDDHQDVRPLIKFGIQILAAIIIVGDGYVLVAIGDIFRWDDGNMQGLGRLAIPMTVVAIVGVINAYNFIDGHDGLSASLLLISLVALVYICSLYGVWKLQYMLLLFGMPVLVFLLFNWPFQIFNRPTIFLGDAGSMVFGFFLVFILLSLIERPVQVLKVTSCPWVIGLPVIDMVAVVARRLLNKSSPIKPDRTHIHHILTELGMTKKMVLATLIILHMTFVLIGISGTMLDIPDWIMFWSMFPAAICYYFGVSHLLRKVIQTENFIK